MLAKSPKHVWPRGWPRFLILLLIVANLASCYRVRLDHPVLAIGHGVMALVLFGVFVFAGRARARQRSEVREENEREVD